jgi:hypothetical protein
MFFVLRDESISVPALTSSAALVSLSYDVTQQPPYYMGNVTVWLCLAFFPPILADRIDCF